MSSEPIILALDTSSKTTTLAVTKGERLLKASSSTADEKRSEKLWSDVASLLEEVGMTIREVDVFSVCVGPGGFTGLRVGMAAVKGFAAAGNKPVVGVTSLEAAAFSVKTTLPVCSMVNAYKGEVYSQMFSFGDDGIPVARNTPLVSTYERAIERVADVNELMFAGDGAMAGTAMINREARATRNWTIEQADHGPAEDVAQIAFLKYGRGEIETAESLKACYVRQAEAEIKLSLGLLGTKIKRNMKL